MGFWWRWSEGIIIECVLNCIFDALCILLGINSDAYNWFSYVDIFKLYLLETLFQFRKRIWDGYPLLAALSLTFLSLIQYHNKHRLVVWNFITRHRYNHYIPPMAVSHSGPIHNQLSFVFMGLFCPFSIL